MRVRHPDAGEGESVNVDGTSAPVEDGTFEVPDDADAWLGRWLDANGYDRDAVVVSGGAGGPSTEATDDAADGSDGDESGEDGDSVDLSSRADLEAQSHDALKATAEQLGIADETDLRSSATIVDAILDHVGEREA